MTKTTTSAEKLNDVGLIAWFDNFGEGNENDFLSNFYVGEPIEIRGITDSGGDITFMTGEHAFAAMKYWGANQERFWDIVDAESPAEAKSLGRSRAVSIRADWEEAKYDAMAMVLRHKFTLDREEGQRLLDTGDKLLIEGTFWDDGVWGVKLGGKRGSDATVAEGRNWLGTLLMARRAELRAEQVYDVITFAGEWNAVFTKRVQR